jgi:hypothetical protein
MHQTILSLLIRGKLATGCLPRNHSPRRWGGPGNRGTCGGCGGTVTGAQMLMEGALDVIRFHVACFALRDAERQGLGREPIGPT